MCFGGSVCDTNFVFVFVFVLVFSCVCDVFGGVCDVFGCVWFCVKVRTRLVFKHRLCV